MNPPEQGGFFVSKEFHMSETERKNQNELLMKVIRNAELRGYYVVDSATNLSTEEVNRRYAELRKLGSVQSRKHSHRY